MTPQALARKTEESNARLLAAATRIATRLNIGSSLDALQAHKPNIKNPAVSMLREREILVEVLDAIDAQLEADADPAVALSVTPPPSRRKAAVAG